MQDGISAPNQYIWLQSKHAEPLQERSQVQGVLAGPCHCTGLEGEEESQIFHTGEEQKNQKSQNIALACQLVAINPSGIYHDYPP